MYSLLVYESREMYVGVAPYRLTSSTTFVGHTPTNHTHQCGSRKACTDVEDHRLVLPSAHGESTLDSMIVLCSTTRKGS
jgi:hypothetical protein